MTRHSPAPSSLSSQGRVLVVDDHAAARESIADVLRTAGYDVFCSASAVEALPQVDQQGPDVVITDLQMPGMDGLEFIRQLNRRQQRLQVLMITAHATVASAVEAMREGAFDYLEKPFDVGQLERLVAAAMQRGRLLAPAHTIQPDGTSPPDGSTHPGMVGSSPAMQTLREQIARVASTPETVLISGESGTGKELVAQALHSASNRLSGPLVRLNCPALSPQLAESELFGHLRGAFTGADTDRMGRFEMADGGTILLDEITEIDLPLQAKLLRVLQQRTFERVGSSDTRTADVRVLASTNRDLLAEVAQGRFREDLYYRLAVVPLTLPPLRDRDDDVLRLADYFLDRAAERLDRPRCELLPETQALFLQYHWPGNVRELENLITRACVLNQGTPITSSELRPWLREPEPGLSSWQAPSYSPGLGLPVGTRLDEMERQMIVATLEHFDGHRAKTAEALGIGIRTLSGKLRCYGFAPRTKDFSSRQSGPLPPSSQRQTLPIHEAKTAATAASQPVRETR